ncbi:response regulator transcription factor [Sphingomonas sp. HF-S3]|uniref:Response regulator transcription factor n=1 Tax=Sphingomonas rustica TaxID=3103142 RepID=A0ABV0B825_9SPHN
MTQAFAWSRPEMRQDIRPPQRIGTRPGRGPARGPGLLPDPCDEDGDDQPESLVIVVDDDPLLRELTIALLDTVGIDAIGFASGRDMLQAELPDRPGCFILDVRMPGLSGLDLQRILIANGVGRPVVFLTGHADIAMSVQAMKLGAVDFLTKPCRDQTLLDAVALAIEQDRRRRAADRVARQHEALIATLTPRERQVLRAVATGRLNKQIAHDLGISEITVKLHRGNVMRKLHASSVGDLVRLWEWLPRHVREVLPVDS